MKKIFVFLCVVFLAALAVSPVFAQGIVETSQEREEYIVDLDSVYRNQGLNAWLEQFLTGPTALANLDARQPGEGIYLSNHIAVDHVQLERAQGLFITFPACVTTDDPSRIVESDITRKVQPDPNNGSVIYTDVTVAGDGLVTVWVHCGDWSQLWPEGYQLVDEAIETYTEAEEPQAETEVGEPAGTDHESVPHEGAEGEVVNYPACATTDQVDRIQETDETLKFQPNPADPSITYTNVVIVDIPVTVWSNCSDTVFAEMIGEAEPEVEESTEEADEPGTPEVVIQGPEGPAGPQGPQGPAGKDGADGADGEKQALWPLWLLGFAALAVGLWAALRDRPEKQIEEPDPDLPSPDGDTSESVVADFEKAIATFYKSVASVFGYRGRDPGTIENMQEQIEEAIVAFDAAKVDFFKGLSQEEKVTLENTQEEMAAVAQKWLSYDPEKALQQQKAAMVEKFNAAAAAFKAAKESAVENYKA